MIQVLLSLKNKAQRFILFGQSNSLEAQQGTVPAYLQGPMSDVDGLGHNVYIWSYANTAYEILEHGVNNINGTSGLCGQELILGYLACNHYKNDIYIHKRALGGRPLALWESGDPDVDANPTNPYFDWNVASENELYDLLVADLQAGTTYLNNNDINFKDNSAFWNQGERDSRSANSTRHPLYKQNLKDLRDGIAGYMNNGNWKFITCVLNDNLYHVANDYIYVSEIQTAQRDFAIEYAANKCYSFELTPYTMIQDEGGITGQSVHYPVDSHIEFTTDMFNNIIK